MFQETYFCRAIFVRGADTMRDRIGRAGSELRYTVVSLLDVSLLDGFGSFIVARVGRNSSCISKRLSIQRLDSLFRDCCFHHVQPTAYSLFSSENALGRTFKSFLRFFQESSMFSARRCGKLRRERANYVERVCRISVRRWSRRGNSIRRVCWSFERSRGDIFY